ncbi:hypothetical protein U5922_002885 [Aquicoccus sp. G2-2]|uniref:hypothetical protein n=1 Tax=Aquicoccus sp. G2-2 TaxID=3092120 RepID=UPI002ADFD2DD|nr:hypothetical protein [Aquicoccus sp. G2-2]MEA1112465.1 hypothetical protein [Aquicoccus sp. G2-2]
MTRPALYILLSLATAALYLTMVLWSLPEIAWNADGLRAFDLHPFGYTPAQAEAFLDALSEEGRAFYVRTQLALDMVFPLLLAVWMGWSVLALFRGPLRWVLIALAVLGCVADYAENIAVAQLLEGFNAGLAAEASRYTVTKSMASSVVYLAILCGAVRYAWRRLRR